MALFGRKNNQYVRPMAFYKEAALHGDHGKISVSNRKLGLKEELVTFVFLGVDTLPKVTPQLVTEIFETAKVHGFIPHFIENYGHNNELIGQAVVQGEGEETIGDSPFDLPARPVEPLPNFARNGEVWIASQGKFVPIEEAIAKGWLVATIPVQEPFASTQVGEHYSELAGVKEPAISNEDLDQTPSTPQATETGLDIKKVTSLDIGDGRAASVIELAETKKAMTTVKFRGHDVEYVVSFGVGSYNLADIMRAMGFDKSVVCELAHKNALTCVDPIFLSAPDMVNEFQRYLTAPNLAMKYRVISNVIFLSEVGINDLSKAYKEKFAGLLDFLNGPNSAIKAQELLKYTGTVTEEQTEEPEGVTA